MRDPQLTEFARSMRREMTEPEKTLWYQLRAKRFEGIKLRRQNVVGNYIADFYSRFATLIIEVDGDSHAFTRVYDRIREEYFQKLGFRVIRFTNSDVMTNIEGVLTMVGAQLAAPLPTLPPKGERAINSLLSPLQGREASLGSLLPSRSREGKV
ncbi:endonuclease domain-containing protein [Sphingorhabdus arenilitoris]|uniref:Endonuclease domain-containing protein n=1 Tax=Sphingorhabdus arenilitoris TaxID=1490041 RepID=A0ABV8RHI2_9SPHN